MEYSDEALGAAIRARRERTDPRLTQVGLGEAAGYEEGPGAGVSISRIESGSMRPSRQKLAGIAAALGTTPERLEAEAVELTAEPPADSPRRDEQSRQRAKTMRQRLSALERVVADRTDRISEAVDAYNEAHDRARDKFFMRFVELAERIDGAPEVPGPSGLGDADEADVGEMADRRIRFASSAFSSVLGGLGGAVAGAATGGSLAYGAFLAAATYGTASTGTAISSLSGAAATKAALALLGGGSLTAGGAGIAGGTMVLAGIVAAPVAVLGAGGIYLTYRLSKKKERELREKLDRAEQQVEATTPGFEALLWFLHEATELLDYIATHAGHACERWGRGIPEAGVAWADLESQSQERYVEFVQIAGAQLSVTSIDVAAFFLEQPTDAADGTHVAEMKRGAEAILEEAKRTVTQFV